MPTPDADLAADLPADLADALTLTIDGLRYALDRPPERGGGKVVLSVQLQSGGDTPLRDRVDLYGFKERLRLAGLVADLFARQRREAIGHLAVLLDQVERARESERRRATPDPRGALSEQRRARALALLGRSDLLARAARAMEALGYVGEEEAKRLAYLVATSRLLARPLSLIAFAPAGAGKSELLDVVARLMPAGATEYLSRISSAALYYAGPDALRHKLVVVDEAAGAKEADYSLRTLISRGSLTLRASPKPGGVARPITVYGPISLLSGTTSAAVNEENLSRCLELSLDEGAQQTRLVQEAQRAAWAGEARPRVDVEGWQDAQRLLESLEVVIPFAGRLRFPARTSRDRRGNQKLLGLVAAHALLYHRKRERDEQQRVVATLADYLAVHELVRPAVRVDLEGLSPRAAQAYASLAHGRALTRRELAGQQGWSYNTAKKALTELVGQELAHVSVAGPPARYALVDRSLLGGTGALLDPGELEACASSRPQPSTEAA